MDEQGKETKFLLESGSSYALICVNETLYLAQHK